MRGTDAIMRDIDAVYTQCSNTARQIGAARARLADAQLAWENGNYDAAERLLEEAKWCMSLISEGWIK